MKRGFLVISVLILLACVACKKGEKDIYYTQIITVNKSQNIIDSLEVISTNLTKYYNIGINGTTPAIVVEGVYHDFIFRVYINQKKYCGSPKIATVVDATHPGIFYKGCFTFYFLDIDTTNNIITVAYNRDQDCDY